MLNTTTMTRLFTASLVVATLTLAAPAFASGLANEKKINDELFVFALANEIRLACDDISPRMLRALNFRNNLYAKARAKGYSNTQIDAYIDDKSEQQKMKARGNRYLSQFGASLSNTPALCKVGRAEIAKRSPIGALLKAR